MRFVEVQLSPPVCTDHWVTEARPGILTSCKSQTESSASLQKHSCAVKGLRDCHIDFSFTVPRKDSGCQTKTHTQIWILEEEPCGPGILIRHLARQLEVYAADGL